MRAGIVTTLICLSLGVVTAFSDVYEDGLFQPYKRDPYPRKASPAAYAEAHAAAEAEAEARAEAKAEALAEALAKADILYGPRTGELQKRSKDQHTQLIQNADALIDANKKHRTSQGTKKARKARQDVRAYCRGDPDTCRQDNKKKYHMKPMLDAKLTQYDYEKLTAQRMRSQQKLYNRSADKHSDLKKDADAKSKVCKKNLTRKGSRGVRKT